MERVYFKEEQKFKQLFIKIILLITWAGMNLIFAIGLYRQIQLKEPWGNNPMSDKGLIIFTVCMNILMIGMMILFLKARLVVEIRDEGIYYRFPPFINREKKIAKEEIDRFEIRKYNPIKEYGGWGIRQRRLATRNNVAYNVSGSTGLQLYLKSGKKILFGTQRSEVLGSAMRKLLNQELKVY